MTMCKLPEIQNVLKQTKVDDKYSISSQKVEVFQDQLPLLGFDRQTQIWSLTFFGKRCPCCKDYATVLLSYFLVLKLFFGGREGGREGEKAQYKVTLLWVGSISSIFSTRFLCILKTLNRALPAHWPTSVRVTELLLCESVMMAM